MAIQDTDLLIAYRPADQAHYKLSFADLPGGDVIVSDTAPDPTNYSEGQLWWNSDSESASLFVLYNDPSGGAGGDTGGLKWVQASPTVIVDEDGNAIEVTGEYLKTDAAAGDQVVQSTGTTTFDGLVEAGDGVKLTGGTKAGVNTGLYSDSVDTRLKISQGGVEYLNIGRITGTEQTSSFQFGYETQLSTTEPTVQGSQFIYTGTGHGNQFFNNVQSVLNSNTGFTSQASLFTAQTLVNQTAANAFICGYNSQLNNDNAPNGQAFNYYTFGDAPNFFKGDTFIGGSVSRNTRQLWESTLTEEQKEELAAGTLAIPANVSTPGDGSFARQWWYNQQDEETQALIDSGELEYPEPFQAANFVDTFDLGDNTAINLLSEGKVTINRAPASESLNVNGSIYISTSVARIYTNDLSRGSLQLSVPSAGNRSITIGNNYYLERDPTDPSGSAFTYQQDSEVIGGALIQMSAPNSEYGEFLFRQKQDPDEGGAVRDVLKINNAGNAIFSGLGEFGGGVKVTGGTIDLTSANGEIAYGTDPLGVTNTLQIKGANTGQWLRFYDGGLQIVGDNNRAGVSYGGLFADTKYQSDNTSCTTFGERCNYANVSGNTNKIGFSAIPAGLSFAPGDTGTYIGFFGNAPQDTSSGNNLSYNFYASGNAPNYFAGSTSFGEDEDNYGITIDGGRPRATARRPTIKINPITANPASSGYGEITVAVSQGGIGLRASAGPKTQTFIDFDAAELTGETDGGSINYRFGRATSSSTSEPSRLDMYKHNATEDVAVTLTSEARVGIGLPNPTFDLELINDSAAKPSSTSWNTTSDERIKEDIELADLDLCYEAIKSIPLKRYKWKEEVYKKDQVKDRHKIGWIAQDVEAIFPKAVGIFELKYNQIFEDEVIPAVAEELDEYGNLVKEAEPERIEKKLVREDVIKDCRTLNADQLYAAMYGAIQKLIDKVETLETEIATIKEG